MHDIDRDGDEAAQSVRISELANRHNCRAVFDHLLREQIDVAAGGEADDRELVAKGIDHRQRAAANRTGAAENGHAFHADMILRLLKPFWIKTQ